VSAQDVGAIVRTALAADPTVAAAVAGRIYPEEAPADEPVPLIVYGVRVNNPADGNAPIWDCTVQCHCWAEHDDEADALATACDTVLAGLTGYSNATSLRPLTLDSWEDARDADNNEWGRLLAYGGLVVRG
jgi:hypothetical protein